MCKSGVGCWRPVWGAAVASAVALGWCLQGAALADTPPGTATKYIGEDAKRMTSENESFEMVTQIQQDGGVPYHHAPTGLAEGGVAGPECLCDADCTANGECGGGTCNAGACAYNAANADGEACDDGNPDGNFCTTGACNAGNCIANDGGGTLVCPGVDGLPGTADDETCDEAQDRCEQCDVDADCPLGEDLDPCAPEVCVDAQCVKDVANYPCPDGPCRDDPANPGTADCQGIDEDGRCCQADGTCAEDTNRANCEAGGGAWNALGTCPCGKYGAGIMPDTVGEGASDVTFELTLEAPDGCERIGRLGDDYTLSNGEFLSLEIMRIIARAEADDVDMLFTFYDENLNVVATDNLLDFDTDENNDGELDRFVQLANGPSLGTIILPPTGWWTVEIISNTGAVTFQATDAVDDFLDGAELSHNNADLLWINNSQSNHLGLGQNILQVEFAGTKIPAPLGACCETGGGCTPNVLPWECDGTHVIGGVCPDSCDTGSCCRADGDCEEDVAEIDCGGLDEVFNGPGSDCSPDCCEQDPSGANVCSNTTVKALDISGACVPDGQGGFDCPTDCATFTGSSVNNNGVCSVSGGPCQTNDPPGGGQNGSCPQAGEECVANADWCTLAGSPEDPVWFESVSINDDANLTVEFCGTGFCDHLGPGPGPNGGQGVRFIRFLAGEFCQSDGPETCGVGETSTDLFFDPDASQLQTCDDPNPFDAYVNIPGPNAIPGGLGARTLHYQIFGGKVCSLTATSCRTDTDCEVDETCDNYEADYQLRICAERLLPTACCLVNAGVPECQLLPAPTCEFMGGFSTPNAPICTPGACDTGSCCYSPPDQVLGLCDDGGGVGIPIAQCDTAGDGTYFGSALCTDNPCPVCEIDGPANCQTDNGNFILINDRAVANNRYADDFRVQTSGVASSWCSWNCFFDPTNTVECFQNPPPDFWEISIWPDLNGLPDEQNPLVEDAPLTVSAREPLDIQSNRCWQYSYELDGAPFLNAGECYWVQIDGLGIPGGCTTYLGTSADGNSYVLNDTNEMWDINDILLSIGEPPDPAVDLAICSGLGIDSANGGCGQFDGACCFAPGNGRCTLAQTPCNVDLDCPGAETCDLCLDNIGHQDCQGLDGLPQPGTACIDDPCPTGCEQDDCDAVTVPDLNDPGDPGDCDAGLLGGACSRPYSNQFCEETVVGTICTVAPGGDPSPGNQFGADTWVRYTMQADECGALTVSTCPADGGGFSSDGMLAAYVVPGGSGCPGDITSPTGCGDDTCGIGGGPATTTVNVVQGQDVYIRLGGWNNSQGVGTLVLDLDAIPCPGDVGRPNPDTETGLPAVAGGAVPCNSAADCQGSSLGTVPNVDCIPQPDGTLPGTCYVSAPRYLSILPNPDNTGPTARRVSLDLNGNGQYDAGVDHILGWVDTPTAATITGPEASPQPQSRIVAAPVFVDWNDLSAINGAWVGPTPIRLGDCEITPAGAAPATEGNSYFIQAINLGGDTGDEGAFSAALRLRTTTRAGDVSGTGTGSNFPNQGVSLADVFSIVQGFTGTQSIPKWRLEQTGGATPGNDDVPNLATVSLADVFNAVGAFQAGGAYAFSQPCDCTGQSCP